MSTDTTVDLTQESGQTVIVPAHPLSVLEAKILRVYLAWLSRRDLESRIWCPSCLPSRTSGFTWGADATKLGGACDHGMWFGFAPLAMGLTTDHLRPESRLQGLTLGDRIEVTPMSDEEALLLRAYRRLLVAHRLREALYCLTCFQQSQDDGMRAAVTDASIEIQCRHQRLWHRRPK